MLNILATILGVVLVAWWSARLWRKRSAPAQGVSESLGRIAARHFRARVLNRLSAGFILLLFLMAFFADFIASDLPIVLHRDGRTWILPNLTRPPELMTVDNVQLLVGGLKEGDWAILPPIPYGPNEDLGQLGTRRVASPSVLHPLGTDDRGRDIAARMVHGSRVTLAVGILGVGCYVLIGLILGTTAGYFGGWWDTLVERVTEVFLSFPPLFLILTIQALLPTTAGVASVLQLVAVLGFTGWTGVSRLVRAEVLRVKTQDYVLAARAAGLSRVRILTRYVLPNAIGPVLVAATFGIAGAVLIESALSFLGFGVQPPMASWGELLQQARETRRAWMVLYPGLTIFLTVTAYNLVGEGIRDALDPRMRY